MSELKEDIKFINEKQIHELEPYKKYKDYNIYNSTFLSSIAMGIFSAVSTGLLLYNHHSFMMLGLANCIILIGYTINLLRQNQETLTSEYLAPIMGACGLCILTCLFSMPTGFFHHVIPCISPAVLLVISAINIDSEIHKKLKSEYITNLTESEKSGFNKLCTNHKMFYQSFLKNNYHIGLGDDDSVTNLKKMADKLLNHKYTSVDNKEKIQTLINNVNSSYSKILLQAIYEEFRTIYWNEFANEYPKSFNTGISEALECKYMTNLVTKPINEEIQAELQAARK